MWTNVDCFTNTKVAGDSTMPNKLLAVVFGVFVTSWAAADPSPGIQWLMNDKVSMLDYGLNRMQTALQQELPTIYKNGSLSNIDVSDTYSPDDNQINLTITALFAPNTNPDDKDPVTACLRLIYVVKDQLATRPTTGAGSSSWVVFFHHTGWTTANKEDDSLAKTLPSLLRISVKINSNSEPARCTAMYLDKSVKVLK
jgi:hypothetical protein